MALLSAAAAAAAAVVSGMYLDAKYSISNDIEQMRAGKRMQKHVEHLYQLHGEDDWSFYHVLHSTYEANHDNPTAEALVFEDRSWTYRRLREEVGRWAQVLQQRLGVRNRMVVGLFINNSPEFIFTWWALHKLGAIPAPINTSVTGEHIKHCLKVSEAEMLISTFELATIVGQTFNLKTITDRRECDPSCPRVRQIVLYDHNTYPAAAALLKEQPWLSGGLWSGSGDGDSNSNNTNTNTNTNSISVVIVRHDDLPPVVPEMGEFPQWSRPKVIHTDASQYLFTSGTTGLPKALVWPAGYSLSATCPGRYPGMHDKKRRFYICLPMFHGTASFAALPPTHATSGTIILARRFSRRDFWADVRRSRANAILYIGEMLRYLVQAPADPRFPDETDHDVDLAFGLGLSPTVWRGVRERFAIPWIVEYYSASEATTSLVNSNKNDRGVGKVSHWGPLMRHFGQDTFYIVRTDLETGDILRDPKTGFCVKTRPGEVGESICRIAPPVQKRHDYVGQGGHEATEKKVLRNVFVKGDEFFRLGDAMVMDHEGYISFHDRLGDTYRAKGHNISTTEVESCLGRHPNIASVNVYAIPMNRYGYDGQLGCAAITFTDTTTNTGNSDSDSDRNNSNSEKVTPWSPTATAVELDTIRQLEKWATTNESAALPSYAVPRFLRVLVLVSTHRPESESTLASTGVGGGAGAGDSSTGADRVSPIMKKLKTGLRQEGFSLPPNSKDRIYWIEKEGSGYVPLTKEAEQVLLSGKARL